MSEVMERQEAGRVHDDEINALPGSVYRALDCIDDLPPDIRACVHELGWEVVSVMMRYNLSANQMRAIVYASWSAPRSAHQRPGWGASKEGRCSPVKHHLDTLLNRAGACISADMLLAFLKSHGFVVVPYPASSVMVNASLATVSNHDMRVTKQEKHRRRLNAALDAVIARAWPGLGVRQ